MIGIIIGFIKNNNIHKYLCELQGQIVKTIVAKMKRRAFIKKELVFVLVLRRKSLESAIM